MSHHVAITLPDGRLAMADYRQPIVTVMRRINDRLMTNRTTADALSAADYATLGRWLDTHPGQACSHTRCAPHGPATADPVKLPPYRENEAQP